MDVDCDGANNAHGACENDPTGQSITAFQDEVSRFGIEDLDANLHGYVVLGTGGFDPRKEGVRSLSVVAVVCGGELVCVGLATGGAVCRSGELIGTCVRAVLRRVGRLECG